MTIPVLKALSEANPKIEWTGVLGAGLKGIDDIELKNQRNVKLVKSLSALEMCAVMDGCDIAVCGGGQTLYEAANRALPAIVIELIENQRDDVRGFADVGFASWVGKSADPDILEKTVDAVLALSAANVRAKRGGIGREKVDGCGAMRLAKTIGRIMQTN